MRATVKVQVELSPVQIAEAFCQMNDEQQAQFFIEAARLAKTWEDPPAVQWCLIGSHLRTCPCASNEARGMVVAIADAVEGIT